MKKRDAEDDKLAAELRNLLESSRRIDPEDSARVRQLMRQYRAGPSPERRHILEDFVREIHQIYGIESTYEQRERKQTETLPMSGLAAFLQCLLPEDAYRQKVDPHIADVHEKCGKALKNNRPTTWIVARGYWFVFRSAIQSLSTLASLVLKRISGA
jgi:hypothetical protein